MRRKYTLCAAVATALITPSAIAQPDTSDWKCEYCPFEKGYSSEIDVGASNVSGDDGYRYGNGTGYDEDGTYAEVAWRGHHVGDSAVITWNFDKLGLDSRELSIDFEKPGTFGLHFGYDEIPYRLFGTTSTILSGSDGRLTLPSTWTTAGTTSGFTDLGASLQSRNIESDRQIFDVGVSWLATSSIDVYADYRQQQRDGVRIMSGSTFASAAYLPRVIDDETATIDAGARFAVGDLNLTLAWYGSFYSNNIDALTWDNPFTAIPGAEIMQMATEPDSDFTQLSLSGIWRTNTWDTTVAFSAAAGRVEQTETLLPATINPNFAFPLVLLAPLDGKVDTSNYALRITARPMTRARLKVTYRFDERDNQTPISDWSRVIADSFLSGEIEQNIPYSYERTRLGISGSYRLFDTVTLYAGYDHRNVERDFQEVADQTEDSGWGKVRWRPTAYLEATFKGGTSRRDIDEYDTTVAQSFGQNPLMRKYNLAYRYREFAEVGLSASLPESSVSVGATVLWADDSYSESELGMLDSEEIRSTFDVSWAVSERSSVYLTVGNESIDATQAASETLLGPLWQASHDDDFSHVGGGFSVSGVAEKVDLVFDYSHGAGETEILYTGPAVSATPLPELESTLDSLRLTLSYDWSDRMSADLILRYEAFETVDWALDGVMPDTMAAILTMGAESYDYDIWAIGIGFRYQMGGAN